MSDKVDHAALIARGGEEIAGEDFVVRPTTAAERVVCEVTAEVVGAPVVRPDDNFFEIGGHSLKAVQVTARLRARLGVDVALAEFFAAPNLAAVAALVENAATTSREEPIPVASRSGDLPASFPQRRLWVAQSRDPGSVAYNMVAGFTIDGPLDGVALERAFDALIRRHEILRTRLVTRGGLPRQSILPGTGGFVLERVEAVDRDEATARIRGRELERPFDLAGEPLIRVILIVTTDPARSGLVVNVHHAAHDGWSVTVMTNEVSALYAAASRAPSATRDELPVLAGLAPLSVQYADYAVWQARRALGADMAAERAHWLSVFDEDAVALDLPLDRPRSDRASGRGGMVTTAFDREVSTALRTLAREEGTSLFAVLTALVFAQLHGLSRQNDITIGTPVAGRSREELEGQIGFYLNMLPLRQRLEPGMSFRELTRRTATVAVAALDNRDYPFDLLVEDLGPTVEPGRSPLFDVVLILQNLDPVRLELEGARTTTARDASVSAKYDLNYMVEERETLELLLEYAADIFDEKTATRFADGLVRAAETVVGDPNASLETVAGVAANGFGGPVGPSAVVSAGAAQLDDGEW